MAVPQGLLACFGPDMNVQPLLLMITVLCMLAGFCDKMLLWGAFNASNLIALSHVGRCPRGSGRMTDPSLKPDSLLSSQNCVDVAWKTCQGKGSRSRYDPLIS